MSNLTNEGLMPVAAVARTHPALKAAVCPKTLTRWAQSGTRGAKLEAVRVGSRLMTSLAAVDRFLARLNEPADTIPPAPPRSPAQRLRAREAAAASLESAGA